MDLKTFASVPTAAARVLIVVAIATVASGALPASAQNLWSTASTGLLAANGAFDLVKTAGPPVTLAAPAVTGGSPASLAPRRPPRDDRDNSTPTAWQIQTHQTVQQVGDTIDSGYRLVDVEVEATVPSHRFTAVYVANSGSYQSWWWVYGVDATTLGNALSSHSARLISLKAYDIGGGQIRFTAVMISNTGADATSWWWYYDRTAGEVTDLINANPSTTRPLRPGWATS